MTTRGAPDTLLFASGGLRDGIDIAKCIALGASIGGMAGPFLKAAAVSRTETISMIAEIKREIQVCMFAAGAGSIKALQQTPMIEM
jgi:isopentenyl-diphosphate Delta-isomerase